MLIELINCYPDQYMNDPCRRDALENIFRMSSSSKNLLLVSKDLCDSVYKSEIIYSKTVREHSLKLKSYLFEVKSSLSKIKFKMIVDFDIDDLEFYSVDSHEKHVSFLHFEKGEDYLVPFLIAENYDDFKLFDFMLQGYVKNLGLHKCKIYYEKVPGGGSQTVNIFREKRDEKLTVLAILDSDLKHPNGREGSTSGAFNSHDRDSSMRSYAYIMERHELENLVPLNVYKNALSVNGPMPAKDIEDFDKIELFLKDAEHSYFDFKEGLSLKNGLELDQAHGFFWSDAFKRLNGAKKLKCMEQLKCLECSSCLFVNGLGVSIFSRVSDFLSYQNPVLVYKELNTPLKESWDAISEHILSFTCASHISNRVS